MFTWKSHAGFKFYFGQNDRYEIHTVLSFISPQFMWTQVKSWLNTEVRFSTEMKSHTGLSSFRLSCERTLKYNRGDHVCKFWLLWFFWFYFQKTRAFIEEDNPSEKNVTVEERLDVIDIDDIGNLEDSPRLVLIYEKCKNLIVVNDGGELTRNTDQRKK